MSTDKEIYEMYVVQVTREDTLVSSRLSWMLTLQGFLFASLSLISNEEATNKGLVCVLQTVIPVVGGLSALAVLITVCIAYSALYKLQKEWSANYASIRPSPFGLQYPGLGYLFNLGNPSFLIPLALLSAWAYISCQI